MPSFLPHAVIPGLVALAFFPIARRRILWMLPVVWLPDLDYLIPGMHRAVTTNVWIPALILLAVVWLWRRRDPTARFWEFATRPGVESDLTLAAYYWASHVFLDIFAGGAVLFWPLLNTNFYWFYQIVINTRTNEPTGVVEVGTESGPPEVVEVFVWFSGEHHAILWFLIACALVGGWVAWHKHIQGRRPRRMWRSAWIQDPTHPSGPAKLPRRPDAAPRSDPTRPAR